MGLQAELFPGVWRTLKKENFYNNFKTANESNQKIKSGPNLIGWDCEFVDGTAGTHTAVDTTQNVGDRGVGELGVYTDGHAQTQHLKGGLTSLPDLLHLFGTCQMSS